MKSLRMGFSLTFACVALVLAAEPTTQPAADVKPNVAVITLKNASGVQAGEAEIISDRLRAELFNTGRVNVMERDQMQEILKEQGFQASGACTDEACLVQMGQLLGVSKLITGSIGKLGSMFMLNMRAVDVQTGRISKAVSKDINGDIEEVVGYLRDVARELVSESKAPSPAVTPPPEPKQEEPEVKQEEEAPPEPVVEEEVKTEEPPAEEQPPPAPKAPAEVNPKNKNRSGIRLGFNWYPGHMLEQYNVNRKYSDNYVPEFDTSWDGNYEGLQVGYKPCINPELKFAIRAGRFMAINLGVAYLRAAITLRRDTSYYDAALNELYDFTWYREKTAHVISVLLDPSFVMRWYPVKLNVGLLLGLDLMSFIEKTQRTWNYDVSDQFDDQRDSTWNQLGFGLSYGGHAGIEVLAGVHVGFSLDLQIRYTSITTSADETRYTYTDLNSVPHDYVDARSRTYTLPLIGLGGGVNFYF